MPLYAVTAKQKAILQGVKRTAPDLENAVRSYGSEYNFFDFRTYTKKPLKQRWHQLGETDTLVQRDIMSAFLACYATENRHDRTSC